MRLKNILRKSTLNQRIYTVIGILLILVTIQLAVLFFSMTIISAVRVFTHGESIWSKGQKLAVISLYQYARTKDENYYKEYYKSIIPILSYRLASDSILSPQMNETVIRKGLSEGGIVEPDIDRTIVLIKVLKDDKYFKETLVIWNNANKTIDELTALAKKLHAQVQSKASEKEITTTLSEIENIDRLLTTKEEEYSAILGKSSRMLEKVLGVLQTILTVITQIIALVIITVTLRNLSRRLTELKNATNKIQSGNYNVVLPIRSTDELGQLAHSINRLATELEISIGNTERAENSNKTKSMFLANMSHEIRTPLSAIIGYSELLKEEQIGLEEKNHYIEVIQRTGDHLNSIINDILDISKIEAGHLEIKKSLVHLPTIISEVRSVLESKTRGKNLDLIIQQTPRLPEYLITDPNRLKQILFNIAGNAVKFTQNGFVKISIDANDKTIRFLISDSGIGIPEEDKPHLFNQFKQATNNNSQRIEGTGLGLALSRLMAQLLGGNVTLVESRIGQGSIFLAEIAFILPEKQILPSADLNGDFTSSPTPLSAYKILVVDDVADNRFLVKRLLEKKGAQIVLAENGLKAIEIAKADPTISIILMDIQMPVMNGYTATKELRKMNIKIPIIALTANAMSEDRDKCIEAGCDDYLSKPINTSELLSKLKSLPRALP